MQTDDLPALIESVKLATRAGQLVEAEERCKKVFAIDPGNPVALYVVATIAASQGRTATAIQYLRDLLIRDPLAWKPHDVLCRLLMQVGELAEAIQFGRRACELQPRSHEAHCSLGACYIEIRRLEDARASLMLAVSLQPGYMPAHYHLGVALRQLGLDAAAEAEFRQAILLDPRAIEPHVQLVKLLLDQRRDQEAAPYLDSALATATENPRLRDRLASNLIKIGLHAQAEQPLRDALAADPDSAEALSLLGQLLHHMGRFPEAIECFETLLSKHPNHAQSYLDLFQARKVGVSDRPMMQAMSEMLAKPGLSPGEERHLHYALGKAHDDLAEYPEAFQHYRTANEITARHMATRRLRDDQRLANVRQIMRTFTPRFFSSHRDVGSDSETPTLIVGMIRSGTTLVEQILSSHPDVAAGGEQTFLYHHTFLEVRPEAEIVSRAPEVRDAYLQLLRSIGGDKRLVTDKMPLNFEALGLFHLMFPKGRIIHCRRNPADTCLSIYVTPFAKPVDFGHDPETITSFYRQYLILMEHWQKVLPAECLHHIDYEEMVANREVEVRKLLAFCELKWDDAVLHHESRGGSVVTPSTWQVRQPIYNSSVGRWRNYDAWLPQFGLLNDDPLYNQ